MCLCYSQVLQEYLCLVDDTELKIGLAQKYKCHGVIINVSPDTEGFSFNIKTKYQR